MAFGVVLIGTPSIEARYQSAQFKRSEPALAAGNAKSPMAAPVAQSTAPVAKPQMVTRTLSADDMLSARLAFVSPAEAFKARFQQSIKPIYLDVRNEADYNLYHMVGAINVPLARLQDKVGALLTEPVANTVFITIGNDEKAATQAWKLLVANRVPNVYVLEGGVNNWIATFGAEDPVLKPVTQAGEDQLRYTFKAALGDRYKSCAPSPIENEKLTFEPRIVLQLKRDKGGGGCG
jgi:rhodanese-related sulfurtransferase